MKINMQDYYRDCEDYIANAPPFTGIQFVQSGVETSDVKALLMWLRRKTESEELSFMLCDSTTKEPWYESSVRTGRRGRPKRKIIGKKTVRHVHCMLGGSDSSIDIKQLKNTTHNYLKKRRTKRKNLRQEKISEVNEMFLVGYQHKQADHEYRGGDFDFDYFLSAWYYRPNDDDGDL